MSFVQELCNSDNIYYVKAKADGIDCYYYLRLKDIRYKSVLIKNLKKTINITDYAEILESGYGEPSKYVKQKIKEKYNLTNL